MALYSSTEFASFLGVSNAAVTKAKRKGKIVIGPDGRIDSEHKVNKAFVKKMKSGSKPIPNNKGGVKKGQRRGPYKKKDPIMEQLSDSENDVLGKIKAERQVKEKQVMRIDAAAQLTKFKVDRMRGEYVPTAMVKGLFAVHFQSMTKAFQHALEAMLTDLSARYKINRNDQAEQRKKIIEELNISAERGMIETESKLSSLIESVMSQKYA